MRSYSAITCAPRRSRIAANSRLSSTTIAVLWEVTRHVLTWYFATLSQVSVVYGSLTTAIIVLLSLEFAAILLLFGAQVIAEYERIGREQIDAPVEPVRIG